ncbi:MAG TPA: pitrilysin family protein [Xanthobacteraceae bacterium]
MTAPTLSLPRFVARAAAGAAFLLAAAAPASATKIDRVVSPGGIAFWLVQEPTVPLIAMDFAFVGGTTQDPADKPGVASLVAGTIDEGSGNLPSSAFHEALEAKAIELSFSATRDYFSGELRTLVENKDAAFELMRTSINAPRLDPPDLERIRGETYAILRRESMSPDDMASDRWWATAFAGHPYAWPLRGTPESVKSITADDMRAYMKKVFARDNLKVGIVGNVDAATAGALVDKVFGALPAHVSLRPVPDVAPQGLGRVIKVDVDVPQSVLMLGGVGIRRQDPDFIAAFLINHILGGGGLSSRLHKEVREKRGLVYSIYSSLAPLEHTSLMVTSTATRGEAADETLAIVTKEIHRLAETGPTEEELAKAKSFLKGSFPLRFDTSTKIATQLVLMQVEDLGIDYIDKRNGLIDAVTPADAKRVAQDLLDGKLLVVMVGRANAALAKSDAPGAGAAASGPPALLKAH